MLFECMYLCVCLGIFVMVSMAVSTASVIESIIVIRLCSLNAGGTPLPSVVRFVAFRVVGRTLCVSCPSTKLSQIQTSLPVDRSSSPGVKDQPLEDVTSHAVKRRTGLDDVLTELRKVDSLL